MINITNSLAVDTFKTTRLTKIDELLEFDEPIKRCECKYRGVLDCKTVEFNRYSSKKYRTIHLLFCQFTTVEHPILADYILYLKRNMYIIGLNVSKLNRIYPVATFLKDCCTEVNKYFGTEHLYEITLTDPFDKKSINKKIDSVKELLRVYNLLMEYKQQQYNEHMLSLIKK